ncbi:hypothetical protein LZ30DRAFT_715619 [Colletotrichum cereale]|nr:hypothetical protein LZ30DRAFT_715619 [Colletotrichum cereale]
MYANALYLAIASMMAVGWANPISKRVDNIKCDTSENWQAPGGNCIGGLCTVGGLAGGLQCPPDWPWPGGDGTTAQLNQASCAGVGDGSQCIFNYSCCHQ